MCSLYAKNYNQWFYDTLPVTDVFILTSSCTCPHIHVDMHSSYYCDVICYNEKKLPVALVSLNKKLQISVGLIY